MKITFSTEERAVANGVKTIVENSPVAVAKIGIGILGAGATIGWGLTKSVFGAGKVLVNAAANAVDAYKNEKPETVDIIDVKVA